MKHIHDTTRAPSRGRHEIHTRDVEVRSAAAARGRAVARSRHFRARARARVTTRVSLSFPETPETHALLQRTSCCAHSFHRTTPHVVARTSLRQTSISSIRESRDAILDDERRRRRRIGRAQGARAR